jgi:hypothetical protein
MRLSTSLNRNILEANVGGIINKFKIESRRSTLFFEDILANYVKGCEEAGHAEEMEKIGPTKLWQIIQHDGPSREAGSFSTSYQNIFRMLKEFEESTGKKAFVLMCAEDLDTTPVGLKVSLLKDGTPYFTHIAEGEG